MRIYIAASWKQAERVRALACLLVEHGHRVYDFTSEESRSAVLRGSDGQLRRPDGWGRVVNVKPPSDPPSDCEEYRAKLQNGWGDVVECNRRAIAWSQVVVLLLPAGNDAHADWACGVGMGRYTAISGTPTDGQWTPSHLWADQFLNKDEDLLAVLPTTTTNVRLHESTKAQVLAALKLMEPSLDLEFLERVINRNSLRLPMAAAKEGSR